MKQKYNSKKAYQPKPSKPFEGKIKQLERETVVLCNMAQFEGFKQALKDADIDYDLGDFFGDNIMVVKK